MKIFERQIFCVQRLENLPKNNVIAAGYHSNESRVGQLYRLTLSSRLKCFTQKSRKKKLITTTNIKFLLETTSTYETYVEINRG